MPDIDNDRVANAPTLPMLSPTRPLAEHGRHRARRRDLMRRRPVWRDAFATLRRSLVSAPEASAFVTAVAALVGLAMGASS